MDEPFDGNDATTQLDGSRCKVKIQVDGKATVCNGVVVAEPVEANHPPRLRCRDCGTRTLL